MLLARNINQSVTRIIYVDYDTQQVALKLTSCNAAVEVSFKPVVRFTAAAVDQYHQYNNDGCDTQHDDSDYDGDLNSDSSG